LFPPQAYKVTNAGSQRYRWAKCGERYTPIYKDMGRSAATRALAIRMYADGLSFRQIGHHLQGSHRSVMNCVKAHAEQLPDTPVPEDAYTAEMDERYTFIETKKTEPHPDLGGSGHPPHSGLESEPSSQWDGLKRRCAMRSSCSCLLITNGIFSSGGSPATTPRSWISQHHCLDHSRIGIIAATKIEHAVKLPVTDS
jgi:hypothetical protein